MMPKMQRRESDKPVKKYGLIVHVISGIMIGYMIKTYFPKRNFLQIMGLSWDWFSNAIEGLGGLAVIITAITIGFNIYKWIKERNK